MNNKKLSGHKQISEWTWRSASSPVPEFKDVSGSQNRKNLFLSYQTGDGLTNRTWKGPLTLWEAVQTGPSTTPWSTNFVLIFTDICPAPKPFQETLRSPVILFRAWLSFQLENFSKSWLYCSLAITQACRYLSYVLQASKTVYSFPSCHDPLIIYFFPIFFSQHHPSPGKKNTDRTEDFSPTFTAKICWNWPGGPW